MRTHDVVACHPKVEIDTPKGRVECVRESRSTFVVQGVCFTEDKWNGEVGEKSGFVELAGYTGYCVAVIHKRALKGDSRACCT
jgi:hypothetical protein